MKVRVSELLDQEAKARHELGPADYDRTLCAMLDKVAASTDEQPAALLAIASATLRYGHPTLVASRGCCAEQLLSLCARTSDSELRRRAELLFLVAWLQLSAVVANGPDSIFASPPLPEGVVLPDGADSDAITDPDLRAQARELEKQYNEEVERYRAKHLALDKQILLATLLRSAARDGNEEDKSEFRILAAAMALAPSLPSNVRESLEGFARES